ncbi:MAG: hypothetical protein HUU35_20540, partial [Armatimonadetes bacterium]|nr:hypothetical protein [Armatimonadota bacterium]
MSSSEGSQALAARARSTATARRRMLDRALAIFGVAGDIAALNLAMVLAYWIRFRSGWLAVPKGEPLDQQAYLGAMVAVTAVWLVVFAWLDMYRPQRWTRALDEGYRVMIAAGAVLVVIMAMSFLYRSIEYSRLTAAMAFGIAVVLVMLLRALGLRLAAGLRRRPELRRRVAVLGAPDLERSLDRAEREIAFRSEDPAADAEQVRAL